jgi:hypothetical protein
MLDQSFGKIKEASLVVHRNNSCQKKVSSARALRTTLTSHPIGQHIPVLGLEDIMQDFLRTGINKESLVDRVPYSTHSSSRKLSAGW